MTDQTPTLGVGGTGVQLGEIRGWIVVGLFGLTAYIFHLIATQPTLQDNKLFFALAVAVISGSFCGAIGYYFGSTKGMSQLNEATTTQAKTIAGLVPPSP